MRRRFRALAAEATREQQTPVAYLGALLEAEMQERAERRERRRLNDARFPTIKRMEDFRFTDNPKVPQATIAALAEGSWIDDRESIIFIGDSGTGKTMLATALAVCACQQGRRVRFTTLAGLANELQEAEGRRELARVVGRYARTELVVLDELGYLALPDGAAELVFQVLSERHERGSLIVTTNLPFGEWTKVFNDPRLAKAVVDRLTHRAHIIDTGDESWRFRHGITRQHKKRGRPPARDAPARPSPLRPRPTASGSATTGAPHRPPASGKITNHNNRREVEPLQASAAEPLQVSAPRSARIDPQTLALTESDREIQPSGGRRQSLPPTRTTCSARSAPGCPSPGAGKSARTPQESHSHTPALPRATPSSPWCAQGESRPRRASGWRANASARRGRRPRRSTP